MLQGGMRASAGSAGLQATLYGFCVEVVLHMACCIHPILPCVVWAPPYSILFATVLRLLCRGGAARAHMHARAQAIYLRFWGVGSADPSSCCVYAVGPQSGMKEPLGTCKHVNMRTCEHVNMRTCEHANMQICEHVNM